MKIKNCLFGIIMAIVLSGCYNDDKLWNALDEQEQRIEALESWQKVMNSNIEALQSLVDGQDYITKVTPVTLNGEVVGYTITFKSQSPITIYNGEKGDKGDKGDQGITTDVPVISVIREKDGNWYWTLNGELLKDAENLTVSLNYNNRKDEKNIYLKKDASVNVIDISSMQFSQEADLSSKATYDLTLERFSTSDDVYRLEVLDLPRQITYDFMDGESKVTQIKFAQGVNIKKLSLQVYLPDRDDQQVVIDKPIKFQVQTVSASNGVKAGNENLEIIPRGKGKIEVRANNLYHETTVGKEVTMDVTVRNGGSRRLDNIKLTAERPLGWDTRIEPDVISSLEPEKEMTVQVTIIPPKDGGVGAQEVKIKTEAMADNRKVDTEDKTVRIQVNAATSIFGTIFLILLLIGFVGGIVWFGMKLRKR